MGVLEDSKKRKAENAQSVLKQQTGFSMPEPVLGWRSKLPTPYDPATMYEKRPPPPLSGVGVNSMVNAFLPDANLPAWSKAGGYTFARGVGGPAFRTYEAFYGQQYLLAGLAYAKGRLDPDWNMLTPWARIIYPGRFGRVTEEAVTGSKNPFLNLAVGVAADPGNFAAFGPWTKTGVAQGALKGILNISDDVAVKLTRQLEVVSRSSDNKWRKIFTGLDAGALADKNFRFSHLEDWIVASDDIAEVNTKLKIIGANADDFKKIAPILDEVPKSRAGMDILRTAQWTSEAIRRGHRAPFGIGPRTGWGYPASITVGKKYSEEVADVIESFEKGMAHINKNLRIRAVEKSVPVLQKTKRYVSKEEQRSAERMVSAAEDDVRVLGNRIKDLETKKMRAEIWAPNPKNIRGNAATRLKIMKRARKMRGIRAEQIYMQANREEVSNLNKLELSVNGLKAQIKELDGFKLVNVDRPSTADIAKLKQNYESAQSALDELMAWKRARGLKVKGILTRRVASTVDPKRREPLQKAIKKIQKEIEVAEKKYVRETKKLRNRVSSGWSFKKGENPDLLDITKRDMTKILTSVEHEHKKARQLYRSQVNIVQKRMTRAPKVIAEQIKELSGNLSERQSILEKQKLALAGIGETYSPVIRNDALIFTDRLKRIAFGEKFLQHAHEEKRLFDILKSAENRGIPLRTVTRAVGDESGDISGWGKDVADVAQGIRNWHIETYGVEGKYVDYTNLGINYLRRKAFRDARGNNHLEGLLSMYNEKIMTLAQKYKRDFGMKGILGGAENPLLSTHTSAQFHRSTEAPKALQLMIDNLAELRVEAIAKKNFEDAKEAGQYIAFLNDLKKAHNVKEFPVTLDPVRFNEKYIVVNGKWIKQFFTSAEGRKMGFDIDTPLEAFKVYEDDLMKIMPERAGLRAQIGSSGKVLETFFKDLTYDTVNDAHIIDKINKELGGGLIDVKAGLAERLSGTFRAAGYDVKKMETLLGLMAEGKVASPGAVDMLADTMMGWTRIVKEGPFWEKFYDPKIRWWTRAVLYGGRASQVWNDFTGDRYRQYLHGVSGGNIIGGKGLQVILPEGKCLPGNKSWYGLPESHIVINTGKRKITKGQLLNIYDAMERGREYYNSEAVLVEALRGVPSDEAQGIANIFNMASLKKGDVIPGLYRARKFNETWGRMNSLIDGLEKGLSDLEAAERVSKIHMDYSKMNVWARRAFPFYYWTYRNTPDMFKKMLTVPAKMSMPAKVQTATDIWQQDDIPLEDAIPEYLQAPGIWIGNYQGKDLYFDMNQLPPYSALSMTGLLNNPSGLEEIFSKGLLEQLSQMTAPGIQWVFEQAFDKQVLYGKPITSGGVGPVPQRGIESFMGIDVSASKLAQRAAHTINTFLPPLEILQQNTRYTQTMPPSLAAMRIALGVPIRSTSRYGNLIVNLGEQINDLKAPLEKAKKDKDITRQRILERQIKDLRRRLNKAVDERAKEREEEAR